MRYNVTAILLIIKHSTNLPTNVCFVTDSHSDVTPLLSRSELKKMKGEDRAPLRMTDCDSAGRVSSHAAAAGYLDVCYQHKLMQTEGRQVMHQVLEPEQATKAALNQAQLSQDQSCSDIAVEGGRQKGNSQTRQR